MIPRETVFDLETRVRPGGKTKGALIGFLVGGAFGAIIGALAAPGEQWAPVSTHDVHVGFGGRPGGATGLVITARFQDLTPVIGPRRRRRRT